MFMELIPSISVFPEDDLISFVNVILNHLRIKIVFQKFKCEMCCIQLSDTEV